jgi:hypothetical protein
MTISFKTVSEEVKQQRWAICKNCEHISVANTCGICHCFMPAKTTLALASCPKGHWGRAAAGDSLINKIEDAILNTWNK